MKRSIVVIEDDLEAGKIFRDVLEQRGYRVLVARHGAEGVSFVRRELPDLVLMDIRMPVMDGWQALRYLRADRRTSAVPVWALSGVAGDSTADRPGLPTPEFDRFFPKPINPVTIADEIDHFLRPAAGGGWVW